MIDPVLNFAKCTVSIGYDDDDTSIALSSGHGAKLPAPATAGPFNLVWWNSTDYADPSDDPNVEIVRVTARSTDTLTVTRAQEGTAASTKNTGGKTYKMILAATKKMIDDIHGIIDIQVFTSTGTWTRPQGCAKALVKCIGGGGEGGAVVNGNRNGNAGGFSSFAGDTTIEAHGGSGGLYNGAGVGGTGGSGATLSVQGQHGKANVAGAGGYAGACGGIFTGGYDTSAPGAGGHPRGTTAGGGGGGEYTEGIIAVSGNVTVTIGAGGTGDAECYDGTPGMVIVYALT